MKNLHQIEWNSVEFKRRFSLQALAAPQDFSPPESQDGLFHFKSADLGQEGLRRVWKSSTSSKRHENHDSKRRSASFCCFTTSALAKGCVSKAMSSSAMGFGLSQGTSLRLFEKNADLRAFQPRLGGASACSRCLAQTWRSTNEALK